MLDCSMILCSGSSQAELFACDFASPFIDFDKWADTVMVSPKMKEIFVCAFLGAYAK
jgi:hypothetical protein